VRPYESNVMPKIKEMVAGHEKQPAAPTVKVERKSPEKAAGPQRTESDKTTPVLRCHGLSGPGAPEQARQMVLLHRKVGTAHLSQLLKSTQISPDTPGEKGEGGLKQMQGSTTGKK
jgi:hypothetical protein